VGKSTFNRWFANRTLSQSKHKGVLLIDLDPGQTEFTPAGVISAFYSTEPLLGPNFTHLRQAQK
jgi:polynucleotide 5'-hydroxyl-kinase GRC3/NOL9